MTRAATAAWRTAVFALSVSLLSTALIRFDKIEVEPGLVALAAGLGCAVLAVLLAFVAFVRIWREGRRGLGRAVRAILVALAVLAWPSYVVVRAAGLPPINDITTDHDDPPAFSRSRAALAARGGRIPPDPPAQSRRLQRLAYPDITSLDLDLPPDEAFEQVKRAAALRGFQVIEALPPGGRTGSGRLEAIARTPVLRLADDVTVRLRPRADGTRIDMRSASRIGRADLGANAARIRRFLEEVANLPTPD